MKETIIKFMKHLNKQPAILLNSCAKRLKSILFLYKVTIEKEKLYRAFKSLKRHIIPGVDGHTKTSYTKQLDNSINKLNQDLKSYNYKPSPIRIIHIPNLNGRKRPLSVSSVRDKIVQTAFKEEIEKIYEPLFRNCSYGFRPKLNCHSAVKQIKKEWFSVRWFISLDIFKCFDKIQHSALKSILKKKIVDQETIELLTKFLKIGYIDIHNLTRREDYKLKGIPKISILSPLLTNIYFHELDVFVQDKLFLKHFVIKKEKAPVFSNLPQLKKINFILKKKKSIILNCKKTKHIGNSVFYKKLLYIRYVDEILFGIIGTREDCRKLLFEINNFLREKLKLELDLDYCTINLARTTCTEFLGFQISNLKNSSNFSLFVKNKNYQRQKVNILKLLIPTKKILKKLTFYGYLRKINKANSYKGRGVGRLVLVSDKKIVEHYSAILRSYDNYYRCADARSKL